MIPEIETQSFEEIKNFQDNQLKIALEYLLAHSPYYQRLFNKYNISISEIKTLEDLHAIPVTTKNDIQEYNEEFLCVSKSKIVDYVTTSGTLGNPVSFALTEKDLDRLAYNEAISLGCSGITREDTVQLMTTMDRRFMAGLAYFLGIRQLGASIIRVGSGIPELQWDSIKKFNPTYLICVPSFLLKMIDYAKENDIDFNDLSVKAAICIGEPIKNQSLEYNALAQKILEDWSLKLYSTYASTEMATAFNECKFQSGGHHHPELIIAEFLDSENKSVNEGEIGELTITHLGVEGMPLLRFKTGDLMTYKKDNCKCGRNTIKLNPLIGRTQQMIKYKGTTLYPPAMEDILNHFQSIEAYIIEVFTNLIGTDEILIKISCEDQSNSLISSVKDRFRAKLRVSPTIEFHSIDHINLLKNPKSSRKQLRVIDRR